MNKIKQIIESSAFASKAFTFIGFLGVFFISLGLVGFSWFVCNVIL